MLINLLSLQLYVLTSLPVSPLSPFTPGFPRKPFEKHQTRDQIKRAQKATEEVLIYILFHQGPQDLPET